MEDMRLSLWTAEGPNEGEPRWAEAAEVARGSRGGG